jgi:hypothetical protein
MYAAITLLKFLPGKAEDSADLFGDIIMPAYTEHVSRGAWIFTRPEDDRAVVIVLYESREAADAGGEKKAVEQMMQAHGDLLAQPPHRDVYKVAMGTVTGAPATSSDLAPLSGDILSLLAEVSRSL